jgi:hypothetical protein
MGYSIPGLNQQVPYTQYGAEWVGPHGAQGDTSTITNQVTSYNPAWHQPGETMGFPSQAAFYAANPEWVPGSGAEWLKNKQAQDTPTYLPGPDYPDPGVRYTNGQGQVTTYDSMASFQRANGGPGLNPAATTSISNGIGTQQALTNTSTRGIISATNSIVPPASATTGASSSSSRFGDVSVTVNVSGGSSSRLQQILNQSAQAFARSLATKDLSLV